MPRLLKRLVLFVLLGGLASAGAACTMVELNLGPKMAPLRERTIAGSGQAKVLLVEISGLMYESRTRPVGPPGTPRENLLSRLAEELDRARKDSKVKALMIKINSPGGSVSTADIMYHQINRYRRETGVKVVASLMSVAASGAYYAALAADRIVALPTTLTGSIGVIALKLNLAGLMNRYGVKAEAVKSAPLKDMWSPFRPASEEERRIMKGLIDEYMERFRSVVRENRPGMTSRQLEQAGRAQIFTAAQALELGLIDKLAYPDEAFEMAKKLAGLEEARLVVYHRPGAHRANFYAQSRPSGPGFMNPELLGLAMTPQLMYLWLPGLR